MSILSAPYFHNEEAAYAFVEARQTYGPPISDSCSHPKNREPVHGGSRRTPLEWRDSQHSSACGPLGRYWELRCVDFKIKDKYQCACLNCGRWERDHQ